MCQGISAIAVQRGQQKLYFKSGVNSHSEIRNLFSLKDNKPQEQVNLEAHLFGNFFNIKDWKVVVDHDIGNIPFWFVENRVVIEDLFLTFVEDEIKTSKASNSYEGSLTLAYLTTPEGLVLPKEIGGDLNLRGLTTAKGPVLPKEIGGSLDLSGLTTPEGLVLPKEISGGLYLDGLTTAKGLVLPKEIGGGLYCNENIRRQAYATNDKNESRN
jgi:hypothetical protein